MNISEDGAVPTWLQWQTRSCVQEKQKKLEAIKLQIERQRLENQIISNADKKRAQQQTDYHEQSMADLLRIMQVLPQLAYLSLEAHLS